MSNKLCVLGLSALLVFGQALGGEDGFKLEPMRAMASWEVGEIENADFKGNLTTPAEIRKKELISHSAVWLLQEARLAVNARVFVGVGGMYFFSPVGAGNPYGQTQRSAFGLTDAHGEFEFWRRGGADHGLLVKVGIFPFKYNEDAKNLGEYMFRTYTYPTIIYTGGLVLLNSAGVQLNGVDVNTKLKGFSNDLMLTIKTDQVPNGSLSLTDLASFSFQNFFTVGLGYMFDNVYDATNLARGNFFVSGSSLSDYFVLKDGTVVHGDGNGNGNAPADSLISSSGHYTFVGQKALGRASLDLGNLISKFLPNPFLGDGQFRVYCEAILMGVKDYPGYYDSLSNRIAYMIGANLPTFGILNVLSLEMEYCRNPFPDNTGSVLQNISPLPKTDGDGSGTGDNVKWTIYARKNVFKTFSITAQAARDHLRLVDYFGHYYDQTIMQHPDNWYWAFQLSYSI